MYINANNEKFTSYMWLLNQTKNEESNLID